MAQRRKRLSEKDIRTVLSIIESYQEQNHYVYSEMNRHMGSITIDEMQDLKNRLDRWYKNKRYDPEEEGDYYGQADVAPYQGEDMYLDYDPVDECGIYY